jgi:BirA family biotin operon repressor/biotin-[acetyl-CoA-carboxylase] ligase
MSQHGDPLDSQQLVAAAQLATVEHLPEAESTMHRGRVLAAASRTAGLPALVIADRQTDGQGRRGAGWWQAAGSLAMTVVVDPVWLGWPRTAERSPAAAGWSLVCGIALAESLGNIMPSLTFGLRWPNDLEVGGRKLAGILAEASPSGRVLFGIGVNTAGSVADAPPPLRERLVTVPDLVGEPLPRQQLLEAFLPLLWELLRSLAVDSALLYQRYAPLCTLTGTPVTFHHGQEAVQGVCLGIDAAGGLRIQSATGERTFYAGSLTPVSDQWRPARNPRS